MKELKGFKGHLVLYCKGQYEVKDFFEGLKRIWAIRCGYDYKFTSNDTLSFIAMELYEILLETQSPQKMKWIMEQLHRNLAPKYRGDFVETLSPIEAVIWEYRSHLCNMQVKERNENTGKYYWLVKLPKAKPQVFNRILRGNGRYQDYYKIA
jgi:hypothetical protein